MLNCLLTIALSLTSLAILSACTAAHAPGQGGISIPNLVTSPALAAADEDESSGADYVYVDSVDPDVPGTANQSPRVILAAGRTRGSVRLASNGELLASVPYKATRFALVDLNADSVRDLLVLNSAASASEYGLRAFDMKKLIAQKELVDLNVNFSGPVYAVAEYGSNLLLALGTEVDEVTKAMSVQRHYSIPAKDVFRLHVKVVSGSRVPQFGFHTTSDCGEYSFCLEIYSSSMVALSGGRLPTNAEPGKHLSVYTDDLGEDGIIESLYVADGGRTSELAFSGNNPYLKNLTLPTPSTSDISSTTVSAKDMWNRSGYPRDLLVTVPAEGGGASALIYKEKVTSGSATSTFQLDTVFNWTLPKLRSALVKTVFNDDDILLMESDSIHVLEGSINPDGDLEFTARYSITD